MKPATPEERTRYLLRARAYDLAADALGGVTETHLAFDGGSDRYVPLDVHTRATLDTIALDLRDMAKRWRSETRGGL
jgi:hypothetical protein